MFCSKHLIPHEDCLQCRGTVSAMRPTIFAELAAAELRSGTECCSGCGYIFYEAVASCPDCGEPNPLHVSQPTMPAALPLAIEADFIDLDALVLREPRAL
jgi:uncharacterized paraquat-inducible protein A